MTHQKHIILDIAWLIYFTILLNFFTIQGIQTGSLLVMVTLTCFFIPHQLHPRHLFVAKWYFVFVFYVTLSFVWAVFKDISTGMYECCVRTLIIAICLDAYCDTKERTDYLLKVLVFSGVFYSFHVFFTTSTESYGELGMSESVHAQRNFVGQVCALISVIAYVSCLNERRTIRKLIFLLCTLICYSVACISGSRKAFVMFPMAVILYILTQKNLQTRLRYIMILVLLAAIFLYIYMASSYLQEYFGERLMAVLDPNTDDGSVVMRRFLGATGLSLFAQHPVFGTGCDAVYYYLDSIRFETPLYAHNNYIELLADFGIVGTLIYYSLHLRTLTRSFKSNFKTSYERLAFVYFFAVLLMDYGQVGYQQAMYIYMMVIVCSCFKWANSNEFTSNMEVKQDADFTELS